MDRMKIDLTGGSPLGTETLGNPPPFVVERRDPRTFVEVALDFRLTDGDRVYEGVRLSRCVLTVKLPPSANEAWEQGGTNRTVKLNVPLSGFELVLEVTAVPQVDGKIRDGLLHYVIAPYEVRAQAVLAQIVRVVLTGVLPTVDDLQSGQDAETPLPEQAAHTGSGTRFIPKAVLALGIVALMLGGGFFGARVWASATTVEAVAARLVAPRSDVLALDTGRVGGVAVLPGQRVNKGQLLAVLDAPQAHAQLAENEMRFARADARSQEALLLASLRGRVAALRYKSPCDCTVEWIAPVGSTLAPGLPLAVLSAAAPADMRVIARVPAEREGELQRGQGAEVRIAGAPPIAAKVESFGAGIATLSHYEPQGAGSAVPGTIPVLLSISTMPAGRESPTMAEVVIFK
ncbi:MAG: hypothetical protein BGO57_05020 [Sphingomonadales bacterium 63-6]|nr:MAG: hypothetical protein BGO57_05020 [Sphingomonadales bacterium 63-6]